jgi:hypothetical protein
MSHWPGCDTPWMKGLGSCLRGWETGFVDPLRVHGEQTHRFPFNLGSAWESYAFEE